jgi:hypothetical protein
VDNFNVTQTLHTSSYYDAIFLPTKFNANHSYYDAIFPPTKFNANHIRPRLLLLRLTKSELCAFQISMQAERKNITVARDVARCSLVGYPDTLRDVSNHIFPLALKLICNDKNPWLTPDTGIGGMGN